MGLIMFGNLFMSDTFDDSYHKSMENGTGGEMDTYMETAIFLQISNSSAILILSARTISFFFTTMPAWQLLFSTVLGQVIVNVWILFFAGTLVDKMHAMDVLKVWIYDICWLPIL